MDLAYKLPNLTTLRCKVGGDDWYGGFVPETLRYITHDWEGPHRDSRHDISKALETSALPHVRYVCLDFLHPLNDVEAIDQRVGIPNLVTPAVYDPFSSSLRLLSYQLRTMHLRVVADKTIFWPDDNSTPSWPNLESIHVVFHMSTPSGTWYFQVLPGLGAVGATAGYNITAGSYPPLTDTKKDGGFAYKSADLLFDQEQVSYQFRSEPNEITLVPFLTAFAKAVSQMPSLIDFALWSPLRFTVGESDEYEGLDYSRISTLSADRLQYAKLAWGIAYTKPREKAFATDPGEDFSPSRQIWWRVGRWRPDAELHQLFQNVGCEQHGVNLLEHYSDEGLRTRRDFETFGWRY